jgi:PqqD family protein of HPr-rel-A system
MGRGDRLSHLTLKDDGFLFDPTTGDTYVANSTALFILRALQDGCDESRIVESLVESFDVTEGDARRDAADLLSRLKSWQLL